MNHPPLRLGTRSSPMATIAANHARDMIRAAFPAMPIEVKRFASEGDLRTGDLREAGGKGLFIKDLERRLLAGEIDCAMHALKDVPGDVPMHEDLVLIAFLPREDPRDALVMRSGAQRTDFAGQVIGTSAPRRGAILSQMYPESRIVPCRGNVDTRLRHLDEGRYDAIVVSAAGLDRLGHADRISHTFECSEMLPAVGQGIICLQVRRADVEQCTFLHEVNDDWSRNAAAAERGVLRGLNGDCHSAIAAHCSRAGSEIVLEALVMSGSDHRLLRSRQTADATADEAAIARLGDLAAADLLKQGAAQLL